MLVYSILLCSLVTFAASQTKNSWRDAAILNEARYLGTNGQFGSSVKQNDGLEYKEEADENGNRKGSYSYIDPTGERRTVTFTAGKDGFKASGVHLPASAAVSGSAVPVPSAPSASVPAAPSYTSNQASSYGRSSNGNGPSLDSGFYNPDFDYPDDSSKGYDDGQYVPETQSYNAPRAQQPSLSALYKSAQASQPSYNPSQYQFSGNDYNQYNSRNNYNQYSTQAPVQQYTAGYNQYSSEAPAYQSYNQINTEVPSYRSQSYPGKLSVNRSPDGFSYTFNTS